MSQKEEIIDLARKYDLDSTYGGSQLESLQSIAEKLGMDHYNGLSNDDTEELLRRMREYDSKYSQSQVSNNYVSLINNDAENGIIKKAVKATVIKAVLAIAPFLLIIFICVFSLFLVTGFFNDDEDEDNTKTVASNNGECGFTISNTSFSKEEFVNKVSDYANSHPIWKIFADNAPDYYDYAKSVNVNPELVLTIANKEGQGRETAGKNNYWGLSCPNGATKCGDYNTFMDGAKKLIDSASKWSSLNSWFVDGHYSWIGDYWYNPGSAGLGGCYYAPYIYPDNMPARVKTACDAGRPCSGSACVKTVSDDQKAYADYLINQMAKFRKSVFGLERNEGVSCESNGNLPTLTNYNLKHGNLNVLNRALTEEERKDLDSYIDSEIRKAGYGTGAGVAAAGQSLIYWFEQKGLYLQYRWGGGHAYETNCSGDSNSFTFSNPYWGTACGYDKNHRDRIYFGMDCSGFVSWATRTACRAGFEHFSGDWIGMGRSISLNDAKPGDVLDKEGHVRLIIKNNGDGSVIIAEEIGAPTSGLIFNTVSSASPYTVVSMQDWYSANCTTKS